MGLELGPVSIVELSEKLCSRFAVQKIYKRVPNVTLVLVVHGQVEEVICT